jgi:hypothetical protein
MNAFVGEDEQIFAKLCTLSGTADLVQSATGRAPHLERMNDAKEAHRCLL